VKLVCDTRQLGRDEAGVTSAEREIKHMAKCGESVEKYMSD